MTDLARVRLIHRDGTTAFRISTPKEGEVRVRIFDPRARLARTLDRTAPAGTYQ